jgi:K+-transporting ATPase A subunit
MNQDFRAPQVLAAVIRGFARRETSKLGNCWVHLTTVHGFAQTLALGAVAP